MNRYVFLHRITGPLILLVFGVTALLDTWQVLSYRESWPLYLIAIGLLQLAKRAAWSRLEVPPPPAGYAGSGGPGTAAGSYPSSYQAPAPMLLDQPEERRAGWDAPRGLDGEERGEK